MGQRTEIKGNRYGKLTALGEREYRTTPKGKKLIYEKCICDCGKEHWLQRRALLNGITKSCGCLIAETCRKKPNSRTHGMTGTRFYKIYHGIEGRCNRPSEASYSRYGKRGIKNLWNSFDEFYNDMYDSYLSHIRQFGEKETTIDRIDANGNYCKENCRWSTYKEQANNRRTSHKVTYNGKTYVSIKSLCEELGLDYKMIYFRMRKGLSITEAIEKPKMRYRRIGLITNKRSFY